MTPSSRARRAPPVALIPEAAGAAGARAVAPVLSLIRRTWLYRRLLSAPVPDRVLFHPDDVTPLRLDVADQMLRGKFRFAERTVIVEKGSVFAAEAPSEAWLAELHSFSWLRHLAGAGGEPARILALRLTDQWLRRYRRYSEPAWCPDILARRLISFFANGRVVLANADVLWRSRLFVALRDQAQFLARAAGRASDGLPRLEAAVALALSGVCLNEGRKRLARGLERLMAELGRQILPDGGHASRSPEALAHAFRLVTMTIEALAATGHEVPQELRRARDRMAPMLRFFRHGDGGLALFNGGGESDARLVAALLARDEARGQPFAHARHSGFHRLHAGRTLILLDCGTTPQGAFAGAAHAGTLAFEMSTGSHRLFVNCGAAGARTADWMAALRGTAAHSALTLADTPTAAVLPEGLARRLVGARLLGGPRQVETRRSENHQALIVEATQDAYVARFGILHERRIALSPQGLVVTGADRLAPVALRKARQASALPFAIRFHLHPDVRTSLSQDGGSVILKLPNGEGWRFRAGGGALTIEESVYMGGDVPRRTEQLVISGTVKDGAVECAWTAEMIGLA